MKTKQEKKYDLLGNYYEIIQKNTQESSKTKRTRRELSFVKRLISRYFPRRKTIRILDIACGSGRHLVPLVKDGYKVDGIDISREMLKSLSKKLDKEYDAEIIHGDMRIKRLERRYNFAYSFFNTLAEMTKDIDDAKNVLMNIKRCLRKGGILLLDTENPRRYLYKIDFTLKGKEGDIEAQQHFKTIEYQDVSGLLCLREHLRVKRGGKKIEDRVIDNTYKWWTADELHLLFEACGYKNIKIAGDDYRVDRTPKSSKRILIVGQV